MEDQVKCSTKVRASVYLRPGEDVDNALRRLKKKVDRDSILSIAYEKTFYLKPCLAKREKKKKKRNNG